jgi:hypothetical protein
MPLRQCLCHLELNAVPYFAVVQDPQISVTVDLQCRRDFADDTFPVSPSPSFHLTVGSRS